MPVFVRIGLVTFIFKRATRGVSPAGAVDALLSRFFCRTAAVCAAVCAALALSAPVVHAQEHIAAVNSDRILRESAPAKASMAKIEAEFSKRKADIDASAAKLQALSSKLDRDGASMSDGDRAKMQAQLSQMDLDLQRKRREFGEDFNQRRNEELQSVLDRANKAIRDIAVKGNYDLIVQEAVYVNPRIDITDKVLKALASPGSN